MPALAVLLAEPVPDMTCLVSAGSAQEMLRPYVAFNAALRSSHHAFVQKLEEQCKMLLTHQLQVAPQRDVVIQTWCD